MDGFRSSIELRVGQGARGGRRLEASFTGDASQHPARWHWLILGVGLAFVKSEVILTLEHDRAGSVALLGVLLAGSVLRARAVGMALVSALLLAYAFDPGSVAVGIALAVGAFVVLLSVFAAIGTVLDRGKLRAA